MSIPSRLAGSKRIGTGSEPRAPMKTSSNASGYSKNDVKSPLGSSKATRHYLPLEQRLRAYNKVLQLRKEGLSYDTIVDAIHKLQGVKINVSHVEHWVRGTKTPLGNVNAFNAIPSPALAYIIGVRLGDGFIYLNEKYRQYRFELKVTDYDFVGETRQNLTKIFAKIRIAKPTWDDRNNCWCIRCYSILLCKFLGQPLEKLKSFIEHCNECVAAFLRALYDSEASVSRREVILYNTSYPLLHYSQKLLLQYFRIETTGPHMVKKRGHTLLDPRNGKTYKANKDCFSLYTRAHSLPMFHQYIGFTIRRKQRALIAAIEK